MEAVEELSRNRTTIIISHNSATVSLADTILVLEDGRLVDQGGHRELVEREGPYRRLYEAMGSELRASAAALDRLLTDPEASAAQRADCALAVRRLGLEDRSPSQKAAACILSLIGSGGGPTEAFNDAKREQAR